MNLKPRRRLFPSLSTTLPLLLIGFGWYAVYEQSNRLERSVINTYQNAQLEVARSAARAAQTYITRELMRRPDAVHPIEQEVLHHFVEPIRIGETGDAWIYSPNYVVFDESEDFPEEYQGKSMALIFALQRQHGARHYEAMTQAVMQGREGVGWYIWQPNKAAEATPWWEPLTQDAGREIAAWSPVVVFPGSEREKIWVIGISGLLPELMQANGAYTQIQASINTMGVMTLVVLVLMVLLRRNRAALQASEANYRAIVEDQTELICRFRQDGTLTFANQAYAEVYQIQPNRLRRVNVYDLMPQSELLTMLSQLADLSPQQPVRVSERQIQGADGQVRWQQWTDRAILNARGQIVEIQAVGRDITNRKRYEAEIERLAFTDPLTGLANRRRLHDVGQQRLSELSEATDPVTLIYLDLDRFKPVNDTLGHDVGDELLKQVANRLHHCIRQQDLLARLGGDEFAILLEGGLSEAEPVAQRILAALHSPFQLREHTIQIGSSLGLTSIHEAEVTFTQLLTQADLAMYRAKSAGRGTYAVFDAAMYAESLSRRALEVDLRHVVQQKQLRVYYQPIVSLSTQRVIGLEAVVRWQHPYRGLLAPDDFLPLAAELGFSLEIERWVLHQACAQMAGWQTQWAEERLRLSVNLSGKYLTQPDAAEDLVDLLQATGLHPSTILLEITEAGVLQSTEAATAALTRLQHLGVRIGLDNFGTGQASLRALHGFPLNVLKIDRSLTGLLHRAANRNLVRTMITLAHELGLDTIAEGIETQEQWQQLLLFRCGAGQGYFFAEPLSQFAVEAYLQKQNRATLRTN